MQTFTDWLETNKNKIFRILYLRRVGDWTPYELEQKFPDETHYEDSHYIFAKFLEAIELPDGDVLVGYVHIDDEPSVIHDEYTDEDWNTNRIIEYRKLSTLHIDYFDYDNEPKEADYSLDNDEDFGHE